MATIPCICPPKDGTPRHPAGDHVTLRQKLDSRSALSMRWSIIQLKSEDPGASAAEVLGVMSEQYLLFGIESWTLVDHDGEPLPCTKAHIRERVLTQELDVIMPIVEEADELYMGIVLLPLATGEPASSPDTPTEPSTSPKTDSEPTPLKRSKRSSTTTSPTVATGTITPSPDGGSSSSPSSASAA